MDSVMIALLPITTDWCKQDLPHVTLVFSGLVTDHKPTDFNIMAKDVADIALIAKPFGLSVTGTEKLGPPEEQVSALMLRPTPELMALRNSLKQWDMSEFPEYKPHATIGPYPSGDTIPPSQLAFDRLMIAWGDQQLTFSMT